MSEIKIEKGVPITNPADKAGPLPDLSTMLVGDSFLLPSGTLKPPAESAYGRARHWAYVHGKHWRFTVRKGADGVRVWRIE